MLKLIKLAHKRHLRFKDYSLNETVWMSGTERLFVTMVTQRSKPEMVTRLHQFPTFSYDGVVENLGIIFTQKEQAELCVLKGGQVPGMEMQCNLILPLDERRGNFLISFKTLQTRPDHWILNDLVHTDIMTMDISVCTDFSGISSSEINPFDRKGSHSIHLHIALSVVKSDNATLKYGACGSIFSATLHFEPAQRNWKPSTKLVTTGYTGFQFLTCYSEKQISFEFYISPFESTVWYPLLAGGISIILALSLYIKFGTTQKKVSFSPVLFVLRTLLEEPCPFHKSLEREQFFRIAIAGWILVAFILTNCYTGLMITGLNAPLAGKVHKTFQDLVCNSEQGIHSAALAWYQETFDRHYYHEFNRDTDQFKNPYLSRHCFSLLSPLIGWDSTRPKYLFSQFLHEEVMHAANFTAKLPRQTKLVFKLFHPMHAHQPKRSILLESETSSQRRIEAEVMSCGKVAFVTRSDTLEAEFNFLSRKYPSIPLQRGEEVFEPVPSGWIFRHAGVSKVPKGYTTLVERGIYARLEREVLARKFVTRRAVGYVVGVKGTKGALTMDGAIITLFILCGIISGIAAICWLIECKNIVLRNLRMLRFFKKRKVQDNLIISCKVKNVTEEIVPKT